MSSALPSGMPSATSTRTMSPISLIPARCASVPPIMPAPMRAIFFRAMRLPILSCASGSGRGAAARVGDPLDPSRGGGNGLGWVFGRALSLRPGGGGALCRRLLDVAALAAGVRPDLDRTAALRVDEPLAGRHQRLARAALDARRVTLPLEDEEGEEHAEHDRRAPRRVALRGAPHAEQEDDAEGADDRVAEH